MNTYLVIDVGGTNIKYATMREDLSIVDKGEIETPKTNLNDFMEALVRLVETSSTELKGIAMSVPGVIDSKRGFMHTGGALSHFLNQVELAQKLKERTGLDVSLENDAKCAALAELMQGALKGVDIGMVLTVGTGIGGGLVVGNQLVRGVHFAAGEISSLPVTLRPINDPFSVWARINGTPVLLDAYQQAKGLSEPINGRIFFEAVNQQDEVALKCLEEFAQSFALAIFSLQTVLDGEVYAIGGGISAQASFIEAVKHAHDRLYAEVVDKSPIHKPRIVACTFNNDANLIGALAHHVALFA